MKRIALAAAALSIAAVGAFTAPASAECAAGTLVQVNVDIDLNGEQQSQEICLPPAE